MSTDPLADAFLARCEPSSKTCTISRLLSEGLSELPAEAILAAALASGIAVEPAPSGNVLDARVHLSAPWGWTRPTATQAVETARAMGTQTVREDDLRWLMADACRSPTGRKPPGQMVAQAVRDALAGGLVERIGARRLRLNPPASRAVTT